MQSYKWLERFDQHGEAGLQDQSRRPLSHSRQLSPETIAALLALKETYPFWSAGKLHPLLAKHTGENAPSLRSVQRVLEQHGLTKEVRPLAIPEAVGRFERTHPNALWQMDFTSYFILPDGTKIYPLPILDDHSRFCLSLTLWQDCSEKSALAGLGQALHQYGCPQQVLTDHGSAFGTSRRYVSAFTAYSWASGIDHIQGRVAHPQTQGKTERFNRSLQDECLRRHCHSHFTEWQQEVEAYRVLYNTVRPHQSLANMPPISRYHSSERAFVEPDKHWHPSEATWQHRKVGADGKIWLFSHQIHVSAGLYGWTVSARHEGQGLWTVLFRGHELCQAQVTRPAIHTPRP